MGAEGPSHLGTAVPTSAGEKCPLERTLPASAESSLVREEQAGDSAVSRPVSSVKVRASR